MGIFNPPLWPQNPGPERCPGLMGMVSLEFLKNPNRLRNRYLFGEEAEGKCKKMISKPALASDLQTSIVARCSVGDVIILFFFDL